MDPNTIYLKLVRQLVSTLEKIERLLNNPPKSIPKTVSESQAAHQKSPPTPFLISNRAEVAFHPELVAQWRADGEENTRIQRKSLRLQWAMFIATFGAFIATAIYAGIADYTLIEISKQTESAQKSARAAKSAAETADHSLKLDERAWITAELNNPGGVVDGQPIIVVINFANTGKSPAIKAKTCQIAKFADTKSNPVLDINCVAQRTSSGFQVILPNNSIKRVANAAGGDNIPSVTSNGFLTPTLHEDLRRARRIAITYGFVQYDDIFKNHHWTKFCYYLVIFPPARGGLPETNNWNTCDAGNDIDTN